ncbi:hypothetical protein HN419_00230 [Candidatus Woesearchaeota archaeon]|jgi:thymidylate kinase|nr:hypothetical protein [Candidatus Woesearchaeota archaeon]MBT3538426.1 hypothetical protein [Candidatus Woesearchaeota archaeon]MBT4696876.1 hypothetical protein [Candidatus Woesearchaeota archaeon]MBT7106118.1 hypothetical protein [Candidatus Woesearchaeota archaeon]MBT7930984.1 hypothetical protein [Candidatus Woesearchaeota archaeon]
MNDLNTKISKIFKELNKDVKYIYPRSKEYLFDIVLPGKRKKNDDIDLVVPRTDIKKLSKLLYRHGYITLNKILKRTRKITYFNYLNPEYPIFDVQIDRFERSRYIDTKDMFSARVKINGIYVMDPRHQLLIMIYKDLFLHGILGGKTYSEYKISEVKDLWKNNDAKDYFCNRSKEILGRKSNKMVKLIEKGSFGKIAELRRWWTFAALIKHPSFVFHILGHVFYKTVYKRFSRPHQLITFIGVDGSGKTTIVDATYNALKKNKKCVKVYMGRWVNIKVIKKVCKGSKSLIRRKSFSGRLLNKIKIVPRDVMYIFRYYCMLFTKLIPKKFKYNYLLTDRYIWDIKVQKKWFKPMMLFTDYLYMKPDILFFLHNDPKKIYARKQDHLTPDELKRDQDIFRKQVAKFGGHPIRTDSIDGVFREVMRVIAKKNNPEHYN